MRSQIFESPDGQTKVFLNSDVHGPNSNRPWVEIQDSTGRSEFYHGDHDEKVEESVDGRNDWTAGALKAHLLEKESARGATTPPVDTSDFTIAEPEEKDERIEAGKEMINNLYADRFGDEPPAAA